MAAPESEFRPAGITVPSLVPSVYHPGYVNVPTDAGRLWAQVGSNLLAGSEQVYKAMMQGATPAARAHLQYLVAENKLAKAQVDDAIAHPAVRRTLTTTTPEGATVSAPATVPVTQQMSLGTDLSNWDKNNPPPPTPPAPPPASTPPSQQTLTPSSGYNTGPNIYEGMYQQGGLVRPPGNLFAARTLAAPQAPSMRPPTPMQQGPPPQGQMPMMQGPGPAAGPPPSSLHPVLSSQTALEWAKSFDTSAQRAVYLPQVPPTGEPGFAFYGSKNKPLGPPIPISQMVRHGATGLAAGENLGSMLDVADRQGAVPQGPPPGAVRFMQQGGEVYPTIASDQGGPPPAPTVYNPAPYQQAVAQAVANPQNLTASTAAAAAPAQPQAPGQIQNVETSPEDKAKYDADANAQQRYDWRTDSQGKRHIYFPDPRGGFYEQRYYPGMTGVQQGIWDPDNQLRQSVLDEYVGPQAGTPPPEGQRLDYQTIKGMDMDQVKSLSANARWWHNHPTPLDVTDPRTVRMSAETAAMVYIQRLQDAQQAAAQAKPGIPTSAYTGQEEEYSQQRQAQQRAWPSNEPLSTLKIPNLPGLPPPGPTGAPFEVPYNPGQAWAWAQGAFHGAMAAGREPNPLADQMTSDMQNLRNNLSLLREYRGTAEPPPGQNINVHAGVSGEGASAGVSGPVPVLNDPTAEMAIARIFKGGDRKVAMAGLNDLYVRLRKNFIDDFHGSASAGDRAPENLAKANLATGKGQPIEDPAWGSGTSFRDAQGNIRIPFTLPKGPPFGPIQQFGIQTTPTKEGTLENPYQTPKTQADYDKIQNGEFYLDPETGATVEKGGNLKKGG